MMNWDSHLRPLIGVLASVKARFPDVGCDVSLWNINGVERPVLTVFGTPWVVWAYIDSSTFMLRGGCSSRYFESSFCPAAVSVGRVGDVTEAEIAAKMVELARQLAAERAEQPNDEYSWVDATRYLRQIGEKAIAMTGNYRSLLKPLINHAPAPEASHLIERQADAAVGTTTPKLLPQTESRPVYVYAPSHSGQEDRADASRDTSNQPSAAIPAESGGDMSEFGRGRGGGGSNKPTYEHPARIPGIAGAAVLLLAVLPLEYAFYGLIRWVVFASAIWLVSVSLKQKEHGYLIAYVVIAVLWNPLVPFGFTREQWFWPDLIAAAFMGFAAYAFVQRRDPDPTLASEPEAPIQRS